MKEIVERLHENRQVELAKEILESHGYEVTLKESSIPDIRCDSRYKGEEAIDTYQDFLDNPEEYGFEADDEEYREYWHFVIDLLNKYKNAPFYEDIMADREHTETILDTGNDYISKGTVIDRKGKEYNGYFIGNYDGYECFLYTGD